MNVRVPQPRPQRVPLPSTASSQIPAIDIVEGELLPRGDETPSAAAPRPRDGRHGPPPA